MRKLPQLDGQLTCYGLCILILLAVCGAVYAKPIILPESSLTQMQPSLSEIDEITAIDKLLASTQKQLRTQTHLRELMVELLRNRQAFAQGDHSKQRANLLLQEAREVLAIISEEHLQYVFPIDYLDELNFFSSIAGKNGIKRP